MATLIFTTEQVNRLALADRSRLESDLLAHLLEFRPRMFELYPLRRLGWVGGTQPANGNGAFKFNEPRTLPDGRQVSEIQFKNGAPDFDAYVEGGKHELWQVTGDVKKDSVALRDQMRETSPNWQPPDPEEFTLHHFEDGSVGYVPQAIHDKRLDGVAHTGGNSMVNNDLF